MRLQVKRITGFRLSLVDEGPVDGPVMPGEPYRFAVPMRAPLEAGLYSEYWELVAYDEEVIAIPNTNEVWVTICSARGACTRTNPKMSEMTDLDEQLARAAARCRREMKHALEHSFDQEACLKALFGAAEEYAGARVYIAQAAKIREKREQSQDPGLS